MKAEYTLGEIASYAGVPRHSIRYWTDAGHLGDVEVLKRGKGVYDYKLYTQEQLDVAKNIEVFKNSGFPLAVAVYLAWQEVKKEVE